MWTHDVRRELVAGQVLDVLVLLVDDLRELLAVDHLLVDVHRDLLLEFVSELGDIGADDFGDRRAPGAKVPVREAVFGRDSRASRAREACATS